jgi:protoheme IX farnesyltransferase
MVALSMTASYVLALPAGVVSLMVWEEAGRFLATLVGTLLVSAGSGALNHAAEWTTDRLMPRTRSRPVAAGLISPQQGIVWGVFLCTAGLAILLFVDFLVLLLATLTVVAYIVVYTPMKRRSPAALFVGAIPGALPAAGGWIAAAGVDWGALLCFAVLYLWQLPHFLALSWIYRKDYAQAGFPMVAVRDPAGRTVARQALLASAALVLVGILLGLYRNASFVFITGVALLGIWLTVEALRFLQHTTFERARSMLRSAYGYLLGFVALAFAAYG